MEVDQSMVRWIKASASTGNGACVEITSTQPDEVLVRNSRDRSGPVLSFTKAEWVAFLAGAKAGEFDAIL